MRCSSCGAIIPAASDSCEFCGASTAPAAGAMAVAEKKRVSEIEDAVNLIKELGATESGTFNIWGLLFPVAFLYGHDAGSNGKKVAMVILIPVAALSLLAYFITNGLYELLDLVILGWTIYVSFLVATRTKALVRAGSNFNMGKAVVAQILFSLIYAVLINL